MINTQAVLGEGSWAPMIHGALLPWFALPMGDGHGSEGFGGVGAKGGGDGVFLRERERLNRRVSG